MRKFVNSHLQTPLRRTVALFVACALFLVVLRLSAGTVWQLRLAALIPTGMAIDLLRKFRRRWRTARYGLIRWEIRMVRSWEEYAKKPTIVEALHLLGMAIALLSLAGLGSGFYSDIGVGMMPALAVFAIAGVCEITVQARRVLKQAWAQTAGKIVSLSLGVMLTAVTVAMAKQKVHSLAHIDPKYMTEFTAAVAAGLLPLVYLGAAGALLLLWATFQVVLLGPLLFGSSLFTQPKPLVGDRQQKRIHVFWYRIRKGKRPPPSVISDSGINSQYEVSLVGSVLSKVAVICVVANVGEELAFAVPDVTPLLAKTMVELEYRPASSCRNIDTQLGVVYMDDGNVSVARLQDGRYRFTVEKCEYGGGA